MMALMAGAEREGARRRQTTEIPLQVMQVILYRSHRELFPSAEMIFLQ